LGRVVVPAGAPGEEHADHDHPQRHGAAGHGTVTVPAGLPTVAPGGLVDTPPPTTVVGTGLAVVGGDGAPGDLEGAVVDGLTIPGIALLTPVVVGLDWGAPLKVAVVVGGGAATGAADSGSVYPVSKRMSWPALPVVNGQARLALMEPVLMFATAVGVSVLPTSWNASPAHGQ
jgi:hypothetical protein